MSTKQDIFNALKSSGNLRNEREKLSDIFQKKDLAVLYENAMNYDGCMLALVSQVQDQRAYLTEIFTFVSMLKDLHLQEVAMCQLIKQNDLCDMLLETPEMHTLNYSINKGLSLRNFLKMDRFTSLMKKAAQLYEATDSTVTICLLDKIKDHQAVLEKLVDLQY